MDMDLFLLGLSLNPSLELSRSGEDCRSSPDGDSNGRPPCDEDRSARNCSSTMQLLLFDVCLVAGAW